MRDTSGVYELEQASGKIALADQPGKQSSFKTGQGHHVPLPARRASGRQETRHPDAVRRRSRAAALRALAWPRPEGRQQRVTLLHQYLNAEETVAFAEGGMQVLPHGEAVVGFGATQFFAEFAKNGEKHKRGTLLFEAELPKGDGTYRVERFPWSGTPNTKPAVAATRENPSEVDGLRKLERRDGSRQLGSARRRKRTRSSRDEADGATSRPRSPSRAPTTSSR